jgi:hypothetical protein
MSKSPQISLKITAGIGGSRPELANETPVLDAEREAVAMNEKTRRNRVMD